ncbi:MAG: hypothetical protein HOO89_03185 [Ferruginibacter sp.]|nr:hypothetical protein [Ferruginibacter sp.]
MRFIFAVGFLLFFSFANGFDIAETQIDFKMYFAKTQSNNINSLHQNSFLSCVSTNFNNGINTGGYWFKFDFISKELEAKKLVIDIASIYTDSIFAYKLQDSLPSLFFETNFGRATINKHIFNRYVVIPITISPGKSSYYIYAYFKLGAQLPITISTQKKFDISNTHTLLLLGIYYGFALMVLILNLFYFFNFKDTVFLYYSLLLIFITLTIMYDDGFMYLLFPRATHYIFIEPLIHFVVALLGIIFATFYLNLQQYLPKIKWLAVAILFYTLFSFIFYFKYKNFLLYLCGEFGVFLTLCTYWLAGIYLLKKESFAKYFVLAYSLILIISTSYFIATKANFNLLNVSEGWLKIGGIFEMLIISYAVAIRMKTLSNDNDKMREEIEQFTLQIGTLTINQKEEQKISLPENELTLRELEIFKLLITGKSNSEIAKDVFLSVNTIKYHTKNIYEKLNIKNKLEAIAKFKN